MRVTSLWISRELPWQQPFEFETDRSSDPDNHTQVAQPVKVDVQQPLNTEAEWHNITTAKPELRPSQSDESNGLQHFDKVCITKKSYWDHK